MSDDVDPAEKARDAAEAEKIKQELINHDSTETRRILGEDNARRRITQADAAVVQNVADTRCPAL